MYLLVIKQLVIMFLIAISAFFVSKKFKFGETEQQFVSKLLLFFVNPCLIMSNFNIDFDLEKFKSFGFSFFLSIIIHFVMVLIVLIFCRTKIAKDNPFADEEKSLDGLDKVASLMTNCAFIGIPLIEGVIGTEGIFYLLSFIAAFNIFLWTFGYAFLGGKINIKKILVNPNILCVVLGIILFCLPFNLPDVISIPLEYIGSMNTAMAMILLGMLFANFKKTSETSYTKRLVKVCVVKYVVIAAVVFGIVYLTQKIFPNLKDIRTICYVVLIAAICPTGMSVSSMAVLLKKDESYAALLCIVTSVVSVFTIPVTIALTELAF